uniref:ORF3 n=1 Tax=Anellovirus D_HF6_591 TaxID=3071192 RepID=A0AA50KJ14_9VIRU|nr:ORF3 [Anellovirus D_HF6_591]
MIFILSGEDHLQIWKQSQTPANNHNIPFPITSQHQFKSKIQTTTQDFTHTPGTADETYLRKQLLTEYQKTMQLKDLCSTLQTTNSTLQPHKKTTRKHYKHSYKRGRSKKTKKRCRSSSSSSNSNNSSSETTSSNYSDKE